MMEQQQSPIQFLTPEESADVDAALLSSAEKFLTRLTISSLRLLQIIAQDKNVSIEELTHRQVIEWFEKDGKIRREQGKDAAVLKW
jgi:predicted transcriptional regulator